MNKLNIYIIFLLVLFTINTFSQSNYTTGNQAYWTERCLGFNDIIINGGNIIYSYDTVNHLYRNGNKILLPNLSAIVNGEYVIDSTFYGFGIGGNPDNNNYQWDAQTIIAQNSDFDVSHLFVSPVSATSMSYARALQFNNTLCNYGDCEAIVDGPVESLAYPDYLPQNDTFQLWTGEDLIDAGDLKGTGTASKSSQQQLDTTENMSYCVSTYGQGWRLPTDIEAGHTNDLEGMGNGFHDGFKGNTGDYMWTSSLFKIYNVKRWPVGLSDGYWENCAGFLYVYNKVRCVFNSSLVINADAGDDQTICRGDTAVLTGTGGGTYLWSTSETTASIEVNPSITTAYTLTVTNFGQTSTDEVTINVITCYLYGSINYYNILNVPLDSILLILTNNCGTAIDSTYSDTAGNYVFNGLYSGNYTISYICSKPPGGYNSADALMIMQHFVMINSMSGLNLKAADIDSNGYINSNDALGTAMRFVGLINSFPSGDWIFDTDTISIYRYPEYRQIFGLCFGDVNASFLSIKNNLVLPPASKALMNYNKNLRKYKYLTK